MWACYRRDVPQLSFLSDHDATDEFTYCVHSTEVETAVKTAYYAAKLFRALRALPIPPAPP